MVEIILLSTCDRYIDLYGIVARLCVCHVDRMASEVVEEPVSLVEFCIDILPRRANPFDIWTYRVPGSISTLNELCL